MTTPPASRRPSPEARAVTYAEKKLLIHEVWEQAKVGEDGLYTILKRLVEFRDQKRDLEFRLTDLEMEVAAELKSANPDMSVAGMERQLKFAYHDHDNIREFREQLNRITRLIDESESLRTEFEYRIRVSTARMTELGGYLQYLAAAKLKPTLLTTPEKQEST